MTTFSKKISFCANRLLLYTFNSKDLQMKENKSVREIALGMNISKEDDNFLKKLSELNDEKKFRRGKMAHQVFQAGLEVIKEQIKHEIGREAEASYIDKREILKNNKELDAVFNMVKTLRDNGLSLQVKPVEDEETP
jgi:exopolysaccharide biosynthesis protein